ncbi:Nop52-domain-containing protein [Calocera viscosa TUFC12733]|uniref:Nop52-domain-containing protein n=1 Tax=Calocera viscosa (strain TUFC12733) TaxID=1330018 RepID=A0A167H5L6_CALVF|nr:Nop52-domain-containing protein [Calocera viscosa TUFC12733]
MTMSESAEASTSAKAPPLGKFLAHNDKEVRDKAVASLRSFLVSSPHALPPQEMTKLWKGIFYCYWHSDKPLVQQALSSELASIPLQMEDAGRALGFMRGFWQSMLREWNGIDRLRLDKYFMLVRKFVNGGFRLLAREEWDEQSVGEWNDMLGGKGGPLDPIDPKIPQALAYHIADLYLDELEKVVADLPDASAPPLPLLAQPFIHSCSLHNSKITFDRMLSALFSPLFYSLATPRVEDTPYPNLMGALGKAEARKDVKKELMKRWFDEASQADTKEVNRRKMYRIWREEMVDDQPVGTTLPE